ncbi:CoA transferase [Gammaproteobacteria bacterium]|nr:CoA transferase [Gammaproteobacteria bacterium]
MTESETLLDGVKVLDISEGVSGPFAAKLLSDLGAETVKVEQPHLGDISRRFGPYPDQKEDLEKSASFLYFNTGKKSIVVNLEQQAGLTTLRRLVAQYDVVISDRTEKSMSDSGIGFEVLRSWNPSIILTTVTGFGSSGPYSNYESSHLISCSLGGWANNCGVSEREPLQAGGAIAETLAGSYAAAATMLAIFGRERHGRGDHVDVSAQEAVLCGASIPSLAYEYNGTVTGRYSSVGSGAGAGYMLPTKEGYVGLNALTLPQWQMLCKFLGREDVAQSDYYAGISWAKPDPRLEEIREIFRDALKDKTAEELFHEAQKWRVPFGLVTSLAELYDLPPHLERGFFHEVEHPKCGKISCPGVPFKSEYMKTQIEAAPLLGEHTDEVLALLEKNERNERSVLGDAERPNPLSLDGIRVVDLSMFFAGPVASQILADAGAEVIKVESVQRIDGWRSSGILVGEDLPTWEASPYFNWVNRNKKDITLDLMDPRGVSIVKKLIEDADVLVENYTPRVMENFGLSYEVLRLINPRLVMISLSGYGAEVSWRDYVAFGMSTEQMSGVAHLTGYKGEGPLYTGMTGGDLFSGVMGAFDLTAALFQRERTGLGQHLDFSQIEACNMYVGDVMVGWSIAKFDPERKGNEHLTYTAQGIFPCADEGWIGISCKNQQQLVLLSEFFGDPSLLDSSLFDSVLSSRIGEHTRTKDKMQLMADLQKSGIPAGAVLNGPDLLENEHLSARDAFVAQDRPGLGVKHYPNQPYRFRYSEAAPERRAPLLGEHLEEILGDEVGLTSDEIAELIIDDVVGTVPLAAR